METSIKSLGLLLLLLLLCCSRGESVEIPTAQQEYVSLSLNASDTISVPICELIHEGVRNGIDIFLNYYSETCDSIRKKYGLIAVKVTLCDECDDDEGYSSISLRPYVFERYYDNVKGAYIDNDTIFLFAGNRVDAVIKIKDKQRRIVLEEHRLDSIERYNEVYKDVTRYTMLNVKFKYVSSPEIK